MDVTPKERILDVFGSFSRDFGGWVPIAALLELLGPCGLKPHALRSAIARLKQRGLVDAEAHGTTAGYRLTTRGNDILSDGDGRIFRKSTDRSSDEWAIAVFSVPESKRSQRYVIRSRLTKLGFAQGPAGSWFAPDTVITETKHVLEREGLNEFIELWSGNYLGQGDLQQVVSEAWDLELIHSRYEEFLRTASQIRTGRGFHPEQHASAFVDYLDLIASWRPLPYLDPGLPAGVTPSGWLAEDARSLFSSLNEELRPLAMQHYVSVALS